MAKRNCSVDGCDREAHCKSLCCGHYYRNKRYGDPTLGGPRRIFDPLERFNFYVEKTESCWVWRGLLAGDGYGRITGRQAGTKMLAHRFAYEEFKGGIPEGMVLDHLCRNTACVNPEHLEPVTHYENMRRSPIGNISKTHCKRGHEFTEANTYKNGKGGRICRKCRCLRMKEVRDQRKAKLSAA